MKAWLLCEASVQAELEGSSPRYNLVKECSACAKACFAVVTRLVSKAGDIGDLALNCLLHCRLCSMECEKYPQEEDIQFCGMISNICGDTIKEMAVFPLN